MDPYTTSLAITGASKAFGGGKKGPGETHHRQWRASMFAPVMAFGTGMDPSQLYERYGGIIDAISQRKDAYQRAGENAAEFFSHPGALASLQNALGLVNQAQNMPDFYGQGWQSGVRRQIMGGARSQLGQARQGLERSMAARGTYGASSDSARAQLGGQGARAISDALTKYNTAMEGTKADMWQQKFGNTMQANQALMALVLGQPAAPYTPTQHLSGMERLMGYGSIGTNLLTGLGSIYGAKK